ncbi:hypothetical protein CC2G_001533 [Coprinopsis cinerea AmutBmut pab1-1]|nr:hypothetical protein CC2G_001533 [Coprinopsis cinerea AmutBmut pab1-1]
MAPHCIASRRATTLQRIVPLTDASFPRSSLGELDLNGSLPITADIMLAMRARIFELEDQLAAQQVKEQSSERPAKRARVSSGAENASGDVSAEAGSSSAPSKEDEKKRKMQVKKILDRLKKDCKAADVKFQGSPKTIKFDEILEFAEFQALFGGKGTLIQPTPQNKPTSTVTIIHFNSAQLVDFFGADITKLKGNAWTRGGGPRFAKSVKLGQCDLRVDSLDINYSKNGMKCTLKFEVDDASASGMSGCYGPSARRSMGFWF